jgi:hypothetical protein
VEGGAGTSLALALCAEASAAGSWTAVVGVPSLGLVAADEAGLGLERLVVVAQPPPDVWARVVATLVDAFDLVLVRPSGVRERDARRLAARLRERGAVLLVVGDAGAWPVAPEVRLTTVAGAWQGVGDGHGRLAARQVEVVAGGRGAAARTRRTVLWLPGADGRPAPVAPEALGDGAGAGREGGASREGGAGTAVAAGAAHAGADADRLDAAVPAASLREVG